MEWLYETVVFLSGAGAAVAVVATSIALNGRAQCWLGGWRTDLDGWIVRARRHTDPDALDSRVGFIDDAAVAVRSWNQARDLDRGLVPARVSSTSFGPPPAPPDAPQTNTNKHDFVVGDSIADGVRSVMCAEGDTKPGRPPTRAASAGDPGVLEVINLLPDGVLTGRRIVVLSTGFSNNPDASRSRVLLQVAALIAKGATRKSVVVLGVGNRVDYKDRDLNARIAATCYLAGVRFLPIEAYLPRGEHVHPDDAGYARIAKLARFEEQSSITEKT